uniref:Uncharacterized protein n=1 Tax=Rangifer tarandus platyrhynchus TaxID=3082113 RepID=A0ACB0DY39_RANTA|nr:unnamed protein product [Rangifer tarandus platyrhynchus]
MGPDTCGGSACRTQEETARLQATERRPPESRLAALWSSPPALRGGDFCFKHTVGGALAMAALPPRQHTFRSVFRENKKHHGGEQRWIPLTNFCVNNTDCKNSS